MSVSLVLLLTVAPPAPAHGERADSIVFIKDTARGFSLHEVIPGERPARIGPSAGPWIDVSPDGRWILMGGDNHYNGHIYKMRSDGSRRLRLTTDDFMGARPSWSPDGNKIVLQHQDPVGEGFVNLYVMAPDGSNRRQLTTEPGCELEPAWAPDGETIAFIRIETIVMGYGTYCGPGPDLYAIDSDGSNMQPLAATTPHIFESAPAWAPDSSRLTYECSETAQESALCVLTLGGSPEVVLSDGNATSPSWSPNGRRIVFSFSPETEEDIDPEIATVRPDGSGLRVLTHNHSIDQSPHWRTR